MHDNTQSHLEAIFARGDRACADLLERAFRLGCRFDGWDDALRADLWERAIAEEQAESGFDPERSLGSLDLHSRLPWDHIDTGVAADFLRAEYTKALAHRLSPPCGKSLQRMLHPSDVAEAVQAAGEKLVCYDCGVACDLDEMKRQRLFFLRRMNAWAPVERPAAAARPPAGTHRTAPRPLTRFAQSEARRYRLRYSKLGQAAYLAHLDLVRDVERKIAERHGFVYWNWATINPNQCASHQLVNASPPLMTPDHVHFTPAGYVKGADLFLNVLIPVIDKLQERPNITANN
jgi:hypothetical protein